MTSPEKKAPALDPWFMMSPRPRADETRGGIVGTAAQGGMAALVASAPADGIDGFDGCRVIADDDGVKNPRDRRVAEGAMYKSFTDSLSSQLRTLEGDSRALVDAAHDLPAAGAAIQCVSKRISAAQRASSTLHADLIHSSRAVEVAVEATRAMQARNAVIILTCEEVLDQYHSEPDAAAPALKLPTVPPPPENEPFSPSIGIAQLGISTAGLSALQPAERQSSGGGAQPPQTPPAAPANPCAAAPPPPPDATAEEAALFGLAVFPSYMQPPAVTAAPAASSTLIDLSDPEASVPALPSSESVTSSPPGVPSNDPGGSSSRERLSSELVSPCLFSPPFLLSPPKSLALASLGGGGLRGGASTACQPLPPPPPPPREADTECTLFPTMSELSEAELDATPGYLRNQLGLSHAKLNEGIAAINECVTDKCFMGGEADHVTFEEISTLLRYGSRTRTFVLLLLHAGRLRAMDTKKHDSVAGAARYKIVGGGG